MENRNYGMERLKGNAEEVRINGADCFMVKGAEVGLFEHITKNNYINPEDYGIKRKSDEEIEAYYKEKNEQYKNEYIYDCGHILGYKQGMTFVFAMWLTSIILKVIGIGTVGSMIGIIVVGIIIKKVINNIQEKEKENISKRYKRYKR